MITLAKTTGALLIAGFTLSACAEGALTTSPNANRNQGALIGAAAGAALGQLAGGDTEATALGAALGAGAGALIGYNLDQQEAELRRDLAGSGATIENTGDRLIVNLPNDVTFATGSSTVQPGFRSQLVQLSQSLNTYAQSRVQITGHTDSVFRFFSLLSLILSRSSCSSVSSVGSTISKPGGGAFFLFHRLGRGMIELKMLMLQRC